MNLLLPIIKGATDMAMLLDLIRYFAFVVVDGDYLNDWVTHLPAGMVEPVIEMGKAVAQVFGS